MADKRININDDMEQLLQNEAENYRMYPSDKVWNNIREELHGKPKWPALLITFISIVVALAVTTAINYPPHHLFVKQNINTTTPVFKKSAATLSTKKHQTNTPRILIQNTEPSFLAITNIENKQISASINNDEYIAKENDGLIKNENSKESKTEENIISSINDVATNRNIVDNNNNTTSDNKENNRLNETIETNKSISMQETTKTEVDKTEESKNYLNSFKASNIANKRKNSKWQVQYYATISNSYRTLDDDKSRLSFINNPQERQALNANVNEVVKHKPALGGEFGVAFLYGISKRFFVKTGLQFNIRQYGIDAYRTDGNATFSYVQNNQLNTFSVKSAYSTQEGTAKENLQNQLYQISVPIGLQWNIIDDERWGLSTAATIQPTVTLNKNVYVVSTDYKYYADGTNFFRRSNINTSVELYLTLKSNGNKWFFGPQIRRQQLPTFHDIYPIKEYRVDYGIKFGFIKSL